MKLLRTILITVLALGIFLFSCSSRQKLLLQELADTSRSEGYAFSQTVGLSNDFIDLMAVYGAQYLQESHHDQPVLRKALAPSPDGRSYSLDGARNTALQNHVGNLTGIGPLDRAGDLQENLGLALGYNAFFHTFYHSLPGITWIYYTGEEDFMNLYPWVPSSDFAYAPYLKQKEFYDLATPAKNPGGSRLWTPVYMDEAGKGLMVTVSRPVYDLDRFRGVVSLDYTLSTLAGLLKSRYQSFVFNERGQVLASNFQQEALREKVQTLDTFLGGEGGAASAFEAVPDERLVRVGPDYVFVSRIRGIPWRMVHRISALKVDLQACLYASPVLLIGVLLLLSHLAYGRIQETDRRLRRLVEAYERSEKELRRLEAAIEQTPESVVITDDEGRILYVNPCFEQVTGYSRDEALGQTFSLLHSGEQDEDFYQDLWRRLQAGEVWHGRLTNRRKDGTLFTEDAVIAPVRDERGTATHFITVKRDITKELETEEHYRQAQKIESIGRLAGGIAHDFNNILSVIMGHTGLATMRLETGKPVLPHIESIQEAAERASNLTRQLLAFARRQVVEPRVVDLRTLLANLDTMLRRLIGEDIRLETRVDPGLWPVKADPGQIEQVVLNLVVNARDAMPDGGLLTLLAENVTLADAGADEPSGECVRITVQDTGQGMSEEVKRHVFEPFFTTKGTGFGTGLGLATCFGILQQSHGSIRFESHEGQGTTFEVLLPRSEDPLPRPTPQEAARIPMPHGSETILLAEDEADLREIMARVLRSQGYHVLEAEDGLKALALAEAHPETIHLLLTDVIMPGLHGRQVAQRVREQRPGIRVLFISGYIADEMGRESLMEGGSHFLQKPFDLAAFSHKVRAILDGNA